MQNNLDSTMQEKKKNLFNFSKSIPLPTETRRQKGKALQCQIVSFVLTEICLESPLLTQTSLFYETHTDLIQQTWTLNPNLPCRSYTASPVHLRRSPWSNHVRGRFDECHEWSHFPGPTPVRHRHRHRHMVFYSVTSVLFKLTEWSQHFHMYPFAATVEGVSICVYKQ